MGVLRALFCILVLLAIATAARAETQAQPPAPVGQPPVADSTISDSRESPNQKDWIFIGNVEFGDKATTIYADKAWYYEDGNRFIAEGNVVFAQGDNRIAAERVEFNTETRLGTFYNASGIATVKPPPPQARPGAFAP